MKKFIFVLLSILVVTGVMIFYIKFDKTTVIKSRENTNLISQQVNEVNDYLRVTFLDIGQGDSAMIEWPNGSQMLVDCGKDSTVLSELGSVMSFYDKHIDYLLITHGDLDHFGGCIDILQRFDIGEVIYNGVAGDSKAWQYFWDLVLDKKLKSTQISQLDTWEVGGSQLKFLYPDSDISHKNIKSNDGSIVFVLSYGQSDILFTGDAEESLENYLSDNYADYLDVEILKVAHHGSGGSSTKDFLSKVSPMYSIISVGIDNPYGHPTLRTIRRLERVGGTILRTDLDGRVGFMVYPDHIERVFE